MAKTALTVDISDASAVIRAVVELADRLPWPHREHFQAEVQRLIDGDKIVVFERPARGPALEVIATDDLLDLMRKYETVQ